MPQGIRGREVWHLLIQFKSNVIDRLASHITLLSQTVEGICIAQLCAC